MPVSKKPRAKAASKTPPKTAAVPALPDRRAMESYLAALTGRNRNDALAKAQDVMYDAWERTTSLSRIALAQKALGISPLCADAYNLLAEEAGSVEEARDLYAKAVDAGELALGPKGFKEYAGHFWGIPRNPALHAGQGRSRRHSLEAGRRGCSHSPLSRHAEAEPERPCLLRRGEEAELKELLAAYEDEGSAYWLYTRALLALQEA